MTTTEPFKRGPRVHIEVRWPGHPGETGTVLSARAGYNYNSETDRKVGAGFQRGRYKHPGEYCEGVYYIVRFDRDGGTLAIPDQVLTPLAEALDAFNDQRVIPLSMRDYCARLAQPQ